MIASVDLTTKNISLVAKKTGRSEHELIKALILYGSSWSGLPQVVRIPIITNQRLKSFTAAELR